MPAKLIFPALSPDQRTDLPHDHLRRPRQLFLPASTIHHQLRRRDRLAESDFDAFWSREDRAVWERLAHPAEADGHDEDVSREHERDRTRIAEEQPAVSRDAAFRKDSDDLPGLKLRSRQAE